MHFLINIIIPFRSNIGTVHFCSGGAGTAPVSAGGGVFVAVAEGGGATPVSAGGGVFVAVAEGGGATGSNVTSTCLGFNRNAAPSPISINIPMIPPKPRLPQTHGSLPWCSITDT